MSASVKLAGFSYIYNGTKFDIPFVESIKSVLPAVDQFVLGVCASEDDTVTVAEALQNEFPEKIKLVYTEWVQHFTEISRLANFVMLHVDADIPYVMQLQSDEVVHEKYLDRLRGLPEELERAGKTAARWTYHHFLGGPEIVFPFCYSELVRVVKRSRGWAVIGDGVQFAIQKTHIPEEEVLNTDIEVFHYGKMKDPLKGFQKEISFQNLFVDIGFPDPKMKQMQDVLGKEHCDYLYLFRDHILQGTISKFIGTHPEAMRERLEAFTSLGYEQLVSAVEQSLAIHKENM